MCLRAYLIVEATLGSRSAVWPCYRWRSPAESPNCPPYLTYIAPGAYRQTPLTRQNHDLEAQKRRKRGPRQCQETTTYRPQTPRRSPVPNGWPQGRAGVDRRRRAALHRDQDEPHPAGRRPLRPPRRLARGPWSRGPTGAGPGPGGAPADVEASGSCGVSVWTCASVEWSTPTAPSPCTWGGSA